MNLHTVVAVSAGFFTAGVLDLIGWLVKRRHSTARARQPRPVDLSSPPYAAVFEQGEGEPERCDCHGRPLVDGEEVIIWPQRPQILCSDEARRG
jgi:hypothetical protein